MGDRPPVDERVFGPNPFQPDDARHIPWRDACRRAAEEEAEVLADALRQVTAHQPDDQFVLTMVEAFSRAFDVRAKSIAALAIRGYENVERYENALGRFAEDLRDLADEYVRRTCPPSFSPRQFAEDLHLALQARVAHWTHQALKLAGEISKPGSGQFVAGRDAQPEIRCTSWAEIRIELTSEERATIIAAGKSYTQNYVEMGFDDRRGRGKSPNRSKSPNGAWRTLDALSETGELPVRGRRDRHKIEKQIQALRKGLVAHFARERIAVPTTNPLPFDKREGCYRAAFCISRNPSYDT